MEKKQKKSIILIFIIFIIMICFFEGMREELGTTIKNTEKTNSDNTFKIISSTENKDIEEIIQNYAKKNNIEEIKSKKSINGFNSIFAVSSIKMTKEYYSEFKVGGAFSKPRYLCALSDYLHLSQWWDEYMYSWGQAE